ncbi:hypothetical protein EJA05_01730 [Pseudomonas oryziphila]|uniref:Uncharacterized protein n=1 Tax=Pseudomonas entomophila TaxID=312306 RepID=A0A3S8UDZ9_9PSED|nr:hypothetical protein EJA05_01730 [Pseudomonas oryziphila]
MRSIATGYSAARYACPATPANYCFARSVYTQVSSYSRDLRQHKKTVGAGLPAKTSVKPPSSSRVNPLPQGMLERFTGRRWSG